MTEFVETEIMIIMIQIEGGGGGGRRSVFILAKQWRCFWGWRGGAPLLPSGGQVFPLSQCFNPSSSTKWEMERWEKRETERNGGHGVGKWGI